MQSSEDPNPCLTSMQFLMRLQGGQFVHDLQDALQKVAAGVIATGKAGEIDVKIAVEGVKQAPNAVIFRTTLKDKTPKPSSQSDILFVGDAGALHTGNPKQHEIKFGPRPVPIPGRDFDPETGEVTQRAS